MISNIDAEIKARINLGYIDETGKPLKCWKCMSKNLKFIPQYGYVGLEQIDVVCVDCGVSVGNWGYGNWAV